MSRRRNKKKKISTARPDNAEVSSESEHQIEGNRINETPIPSGTGRRGKKKNKAREKYVYEDSESDREDDCEIICNPSGTNGEKIHPSTGITCKKHKPCGTQPLTRIRTLYSRFPRDSGRLICLHLISTVLIYLMVYPLVNYFWTYLLNADDEVAKLFRYIDDEPNYKRGYVSHLRSMKWLSFPRITAESLALLLAAVIKDAAIIHWEGVMEDISLTSMVGSHIAKRYKR